MTRRVHSLDSQWWSGLYRDASDVIDGLPTAPAARPNKTTVKTPASLPSLDDHATSHQCLLDGDGSNFQTQVRKRVFSMLLKNPEKWDDSADVTNKTIEATDVPTIAL